MVYADGECYIWQFRRQPSRGDLHLPAAAGGTRGAGRHRRLGWHGQKPEMGQSGAPGPPGGWVSKPAACSCVLRPRIGVMKVMLEEGGSKEAAVAIPKLVGAGGLAALLQPPTNQLKPHGDVPTLPHGGLEDTCPTPHHPSLVFFFLFAFSASPPTEGKQHVHRTSITSGGRTSPRCRAAGTPLPRSPLPGFHSSATITAAARPGLPPGCRGVEPRRTWGLGAPINRAPGTERLFLSRLCAAVWVCNCPGDESISCG